MTLTRPMLAVALAGMASCLMGCGPRFDPTSEYAEFDGVSSLGLRLYFRDAASDVTTEKINKVEAAIIAHLPGAGITHNGFPVSQGDLMQLFDGTPVFWRGEAWRCDYFESQAQFCDGENYGDYIVVAVNVGCETRTAYGHELYHTILQQFTGDSDSEHKRPEWVGVNTDWMPPCE